MGRLIVSAQVTVDGVLDHLDDWFDPEDESGRHGLEQLRAASAVILGRETYEFLSGFWPAAEGPYAELINPIPKYVASRTLREPLTWNARLLGADATEAVAALKAESPDQLIVYGCGELANDLARRGLVDEVRLWVHPIVWGDGVRVFHAGELPVRMRLVGARTFPSDVVLLSYQPLRPGGDEVPTVR
jgi:dihydrofolate reductase